MTPARRLIVLNLLLLPPLAAASLASGVADLHWAQLWQQPENLQLLLASRLPRTLAVLLTGGTLAVAGMTLQIVLKNRFVEPSMVGATQSAAVGILLISLCWPAAAPLAKMASASAAALLGIGVFLLLLRRLPPHQTLMTPLLGILYGNIIEAAATFIALETDTLQLLTVWFNGDFSGILAGRYELLWLTASLALLTYLLADQLTIAGLGRSISTSLGVPHERMVILALLTVAMTTATVVVTVGQIPFLGLIVPNIVTRLASDRLRHNLPTVALLGANALLSCDIASRTLAPPYEIPASLLFGLPGAVLFLYLLLRQPARHA